MELHGHKTIEDFFKAIKEEEKHKFPHDHAYVTRYNYLASELNKWIHPFVVKGGMTKDGGYLNDHGPDHIQKVILRASQLLEHSSINLSDYEIYVMLMSIHIHDVGNIMGREGHEINSMEVINKFGVSAGQDRIEWDCIFEIAEAHGGNPKDKISELTEVEILDYPVRKPLLASLLKLADELAEDRTRASRFQLDAGLIPEEAEIYHKYSFCLHSVKIDGLAKQIKLSFDVEEDDLCKKFKKKVMRDGKEVTEDVFLINEIYARTYKTHLERMYCMRFTRPDLQIDKIRVDIQITTNQKDERNRSIKRHIVYDIGEVGYPSTSAQGIFSICPELEKYTGEELCQMSTNHTLKDVTATY